MSPIATSAAIAGAMTRLSRARWLEVWTEPSREQAWREHRRILGFIKADDPDSAAREAAAHITAKVGMIDSGSAMAEMKVARKSRRNRNTTATASAAPS